MNRAEYAVFAADLRSHGKSAGAREHIPQLLKNLLIKPDRFVI